MRSSIMTSALALVASFMVLAAPIDAPAAGPDSTDITVALTARTEVALAPVAALANHKSACTDAKKVMCSIMLWISADCGTVCSTQAIAAEKLAWAKMDQAEEDAKKKAEYEKKMADEWRKKVEADKKVAEERKKMMEDTKKAAEDAKKIAEEAKKMAEEERKKAAEERKKASKERKKAEEERKLAEEVRKKMEDEKKKVEEEKGDVEEEEQEE